MDDQDHYATLGVKPTASQEELKEAYRKEAFKPHPDRNQGDATAEQRFKRVVEAYTILEDAEKGRHYDQERSTAAYRFEFRPTTMPYGAAYPNSRIPSDQWNALQARYPHSDPLVLVGIWLYAVLSGESLPSQATQQPQATWDDVLPNNPGTALLLKVATGRAFIGAIVDLFSPSDVPQLPAPSEQPRDSRGRFTKVKSTRK